MKKSLIVLGVAVCLVVAVVVLGITQPWSGYERVKPTGNTSDTVSTENTASEPISEPSIELVLGNFTEFLIENYYNNRFVTFVRIKDIDGDGADELLLKQPHHSSFIEVFAYKDGVVRIGRINSHTITEYYECETLPGICRVATENNICYYSTIKDGLLVEEQVWYQKVDVSEDENLVQETRNAYDNNTALEFEVLSSFDEINQHVAANWYDSLSRKTNYWTQTAVSVSYYIYYIADDGLYYKHQSDGTSKKLIDGEIRGLWDAGNSIYYSTPTAVMEYVLGYDNRLNTIWDISMMPKGNGIDTSEGILDFKLHGDYIYIKNSVASAFRVNLKTKKTEMFLEDVSDAVFDDKYCYYIDDYQKTFSVYSIDLETLEKRLVAGEGLSNPKRIIISRVFMIGGELYYYDRVTEKICSLDGNVAIVGDPEVTSGQDDDVIYYAAQNGDRITLYSFDGQNSDVVVHTNDKETVNGHYVITNKWTFVVPYDQNEKISVLGY